MRIVGHGIDAVEVARIRRLLDEHGERFLTRCFTPSEQAYSADARRRAEHLAARFAAKEATLKALGTGLTGGICWTDIEVRREPSGRPTIRLHGRAADAARCIGAQTWLLSLSHTHSAAFASVIACGPDPV